MLEPTDTTLLAELFAKGVYVAEYWVPEPSQLVKVPEERFTSADTKLVLASDKTNVNVAVWPVNKVLWSDVTAIVGSVVSNNALSELLSGEK